ncbi:hypothetical protein DFA_05100 [Cavenderia fasciculata]|uniref:Uncharacterized protein n=1 Tax=Cavenderia fasciculata TaxID=261658 RepID=F4PNB7_CACFS|nr:uncharacterized protein DFA_05100 [Cavenderia fasciculata]EGG22970.1 hypothetical protein DFA_05100 [Cavenderia fasciculata]|eukprot:XP_004360821.1 hypothetical protein DFA_05100 [Cavenderia fasciculata]
MWHESRSKSSLQCSSFNSINNYYLFNYPMVLITTSKHMHELLLNHIKQSKEEFVHHEMELIQLMLSNQLEYKGIHHQECAQLFQKLLDTFTAPPPSDLSLAGYALIALLQTYLVAFTEIVQQIIVTKGNITTHQILQERNNH